MTIPYQKKANKNKVLGHRGAREEVLENSQAGFLHTQSLQARGLAGIEFDVQLTADGKLVAFHDDTISRIFNRQGRVSQLPAQFFTKNLPHHQRQSHQILTLNQMPNLLEGYQHIELEIKTHSRTNHQALLFSLRSYLSEFSKSLPICLTSFDSKLLTLLQADNQLNHLPRGLLIEKNMTPNELVYQALKLQCSQVGVLASAITPELVTKCHQAQLTVTAWTVNNLTQARYLLDLSVDWIITDKPSWFLARL